MSTQHEATITAELHRMLRVSLQYGFEREVVHDSAGVQIKQQCNVIQFLHQAE